ncbi:MAG: hypothetical protein K6E51_14615 [Treponema sp.]|nr:hypothetical protein [Treponema sp.]
MIKARTTTKPYDVSEQRRRIVDFFTECLNKNFSPPVLLLATTLGCRNTQEFWRWRESSEFSEEWRQSCSYAFTTLQRLRWLLQKKDRPHGSNGPVDAQIWQYSANHKPENAKELRHRLLDYFDDYKKYSVAPSLAIIELEAGASYDGEFLKWCDGVGCADEWRDTCREAYKRMRKIILSWRYSAVQNAKRIYTRDKDNLERWWLNA